MNASGCVNSPRNQSPLSSSPLALRLPLLSDGLPRAKVCLSKTNPQLVFLLALSYLLRVLTNTSKNYFGCVLENRRTTIDKEYQICFVYCQCRLASKALGIEESQLAIPAQVFG